MRDPTERFADRAADYVKHRPSYPADAIDFVMQALALQPGDVVADLGAGTGISSALFVERGVHVIGIEPSASMRAEAERMLAGRLDFVARDGTAERTGLADASVDAVIAAQAFHWFDPERARDEARRILRRSARPADAALLWNARRETGSAFLEAYEALLLARATDYAKVRHQNVASGDALERFFGRVPDRWQTTNVQRFDWEGLRGRAASSSYVPAPTHPDHDGFFAALRALFDRTSEDGTVRFEYQLDVYSARLG